MPHPPESWKADYERDGYLVVEELVDAEALGRLRDAVERITRDPDALPPNLITAATRLCWGSMPGRAAWRRWLSATHTAGPKGSGLPSPKELSVPNP
jgi:ectoine hydroxylase-related dioxygenase (phytanoyl-CoA dioxygenase family)